MHEKLGTYRLKQIFVSPLDCDRPLLMQPFQLRRWCLTYPNCTLKFFWTERKARAWAEANPEHFLYSYGLYRWKLVREGYRR